MRGLLLLPFLILPPVVWAQHARYDTYTGFDVDTTAVLPASETHPSLYFSADFVETLRARKEDSASRYYELWVRFRADALRFIDDNAADLDENDRPRAAKTLAFWWILEQDEAALQKAREMLLLAYDGVPQTGEKPYDEIYRATWLQNYAAAYDWVYDRLEPAEHVEIRRRIAEETQYLRDNLMVGDRLAPRPHNHRSKPAWAIGTAALVLSEHPMAADWLSHALDAANTVTRYQFSADGIYREGGHYWMYNAVNLIPFLWHYYNVSGVSLFEEYQPAFEWPIRVRTSRGMMPNIEDSWLKPAPTHMVAAAYVGSPTELNPQSDFAAVCQWNFISTILVSNDYTGATNDVTWEIDDYILYDNAIAVESPTALPIQQLSGGQIVFRNTWDRGPEDRYLLFHGVAEGDNHNRPDQLSFFLAGRDAILAPDAGYGPAGFSDDRRSSWYTRPTAHNIVTADGYAPVTDSLLRTPFVFNVTPPTGHFMHAPYFSFAEKESGYLRPNGARQVRAISFIDEDYFVVADILTGSAEHTWRSYLHGRGTFERTAHIASWKPFENRYGTAARLDAFFFPETASIRHERGYISLFKDERYEQFVEHSQTGSEAAFLQVLVPEDPNGPQALARDLSADSYVAAALEKSGNEDFFMLQQDSEDQTLDAFATDASFAWARRTSDGWTHVAVREATMFVAEGMEVVADLPATLALDVGESGVLRAAISWSSQALSLEVRFPGAESIQEVTVNGHGIPFTLQNGRIIFGGATGTEPIERAPSDVALHVYPNPFRNSVSLALELERAGPYQIEIYDLLGRLIQTFTGHAVPGALHEHVRWDGRRSDGGMAPAGVYFLRSSDSAGTLAVQTLVRIP